MKRILTLTILLIGFIIGISPVSNAANIVSHTIIFNKSYKNSNSEKFPVIEPGLGNHRSTGRQIIARINKSEGLVIPDINESEILEYYVLDENDNLMASFLNNKDFVSFVYAQKGTIEIYIELEDYWLYGYLTL